MTPDQLSNSNSGPQTALVTPPSFRPPKSITRWVILAVVALLVLGGIGYAAIKLGSGNSGGTAKATPAPSVQPGVSTSERSKLKDAEEGTSQLDVTTVTADSADLGQVLAKALQISGDVTVQGGLRVTGSATFTGGLVAATLAGNGGQITSVNAALLGGQPRSYYEGLVGGNSAAVNSLVANAALRNANNTFTAANTFNGGVTAAGLTVNGTTNLGATTISSLVLGAPLSANQGGTGLASVPAQGIVYGQGGPAMAVATPVSAGQCLISGATDVQWGSCSGSAAGVGSLNGATGIVTISGATAVGTTITINDATSGAKGIASFDTTNFSVTGGNVNTVQSIAVSAAPSFAGITLAAALGVTSGGTGTNNLTANGVIVGGGTSALTSVTAASAGLCLISGSGAPAFTACPGTGGVSTIDGQSGALTITGTTGTAGVITIQDASTTQKGLAQFSATNFTVSGGTANTIQNIATTSSPTFAAVNTNGINPTAALTVGATGQNLTLQGSNTTVSATNGANVASLTFVAPTTNVTYRLQTAAAGTYDVCTTAGNCVGVGGSVTTSGGSAGVIPKYTSASGIGPSLLTDNGTLVTVGGNLSVTGTVSFTTALPLTSGGTGSATATGARTNLGAAAAGSNSDITALSGLTTAISLGQGGTGATSATGARTNLGAAASGANADITSLAGLTTALSVLQGGTGATSLTANGVLLGNGTSAISAITGTTGQCLVATTGSAPTFQSCPGATGVSSLNSQNGAVTISNASGSGGIITIDNASTVAKGIASFNSSNFSVASGAVNTIQNIGTGATPTFAGLNANSLTPSAALTVGATGQSFTIQGNGSSTISATASGSTTTVGFLAPTANTTINFPASAAGTYTVCTTIGNCVGGGGGVTTPGGTSGKLPKFTGAQTLADSIISDSGTAITVAGGAVVQGAGGLSLGVGSTTTGKIAFNNASNGNTTTLQSGAAGSNLTFTLPVADGASGDCLVTNASGVLSFSACLSGSGGGSGGVSSLNGLSGALNVANATASGATITLNDASTSAKGIAQFSATNFQAALGTVNTIQNINSTATPTFAALSLTATGSLSLGSGTALGQLSLRDGSSAFSTTFQPATLGANRTITVPNATGTLAVSASGNIALDAAGNLTFSGTLPVANGGTGSGTAAGARTNLGAAASGANADISSTTALNTITPNAALTVGAASQNLTLQGANTTITATNGANVAQLTFVSPTSNVVYRLQTAAAGTYDVCTTAGNCTGTGGGVTSPGGTTGQLAKFTASGVIGDSIISDNGTTASITGGLSVAGNTLFTAGVNRSISLATAASGNSGDNLTLNAGNGNGTNKNGGNLVLQGGTNTGTGTPGVVKVLPAADSIVAFTVQTSGGLAVLSVDTTVNNRALLGTPSISNGKLAFSNSTNGFIAVLQAPNVTAADKTITLPDASGTVAVSASGYLSLSAVGNLTFAGTLAVADGGTGSTTAAGARTNLGAAASGTNADITSTTALNTITPSSALSIGSTGLNTTIQGASTTITANNAGNAAQLSFVTPTANVIYRLQTAAAGTYDVCTTVGNCTGVGGSVTSPGGTTNKLAKFSGTNAISDSILTDNGTTVSVAGNETISGTLGVTGAVTLTTALGVASGGTGASALASNGVLIGGGTTAISSLVAGSAGQCLISTAGAPTWTTCPGSGGVVSVNGATGTLTIANSSAAGSTITIDNASTAAKGIASFNSTNFTATSGAVNTIQNINSSATPTFAGVNANALTPSAALTVGATGQSITIQGNASSTFVSSNGTNTTTLAFANPGANATFRIPTAATGTYDICTTAGNCAGATGVNLQGSTPGSQQTGNFNVSGVGIAGTSLLTPLLDTLSAGTLNIGTTTATAIGLNQNTTIASGKNLTVVGGATTFNGSTGGSSTALTINATNGGNYGLVINGAASQAVSLLQVNNSAGSSMVTIQNDGSLSVRPGVDSLSAFNVKDRTSDLSVFSVDTTNGRVGIGLGAYGYTMPTSRNGLEVRGGLRVSGGLYDTVVTPQGASLDAQLNVIGTNMSAFQQMVALTIPSGAADLARGISVFDARTTTNNQQSIAVFNPGETDAVGFVWDGSNAVGLVKTLGTADIGFKTGNLLGARLSTGGTLMLGTAAANNTQTAMFTAIGYNGPSGTGGGAADDVMYVQGGTGGSSTASGNNSGTGGNITLKGGNGGNAVSGSVNGQGGNITLMPGAAGAGAGSAGASGRVIVKSQTDAVGTFQIQNAAGNSVMQVNTALGVVGLGDNNATTGKLVFGNAGNSQEIGITVPSSGVAGYTLTLPNSVGSTGDCLTLTNGTGSLGFASCGGGGGGSYINNGTTTQAGNFNIQSTSASSVGGVIQGAVSQTADLLDLRDSTGSEVAGFDAYGNLSLAGLSAHATSTVDVYNSSTTALTLTQNNATATVPVAVIKGGATPTSAADLMQFQDSATTVLSRINNAGDLVFGTSAAHSISAAAQSTTNTAGVGVTVAAGAGNGTAAGGTLSLTGGNAGATNASGGNVTLSGGTKSGSGASGGVIVKPQTGNDSTTAFQIQNASGTSLFNTSTTGSGAITVVAATAINNTGSAITSIGSTGGGATGINGGSVSLNSGGTLALASTGNVTISSANLGVNSAGTITFANAGTAIAPNLTSGSSLAMWMQPGSTAVNGATGANLNLIAGNSTGTGATGGNLNLDAGATGGTTGGDINIGGTSAKNITLGNANVNTGITIGSTNSSFDQIINIGTNSQSGPANFTTIGSTAGTSQTTIRGGTGTSALALQAGSGGTIKIGSTSVAGTITIGNTGGAVVQGINIGTNSNAGGTNTVVIGNSTATASTVTINGGTGSSAVNINSGTNGSINTTANGTGNINLTSNSSSSGVITKSGTNSTTAFQVQNASSTAVFGVDTANSRVGVGDFIVGSITGQLEIVPTNTARAGLRVSAPTSYTGNYLEVGSSIGSTADVLRLQSNGNLQILGGNFGSFGQSAASTSSVDTLLTSGNVSGATSNSGQVTIRSGLSSTSGNTGALTVISGAATSGNSGSITVDSGTASGTAGTVFVAGANAPAVTVGRSTANVVTTLRGTTILRPGSADAVTAVQVQNAAGTTNIFTADTVNSRIGIGTAAPTATLHVAGNQSVSALGLTGVALRVAGATYTDTGTAASGTVAQGNVSTFAIPTITASNTGVTYTTASTLYINGPPAAGTNVTIGSAYAIYSNGATYIAGASTLNGSVTANSNITLTGGNLGVTGAASGVALTVTGTATGSPTAIINPASGQTADVLRVRNASLNTAFKVAADGSTSVTDAGLTISGTNTTSNSMLGINNTLNSSSLSSQYGIQNQVSFNPSGASLTAIYGLVSGATISGSALNITTASGGSFGLNTGAGYTGKVSNGYGLQVSALSEAGSQLIDNYVALSIAANTDNTGNTAGTINNYQLRVGANTAAAGTGGTMNNYGMYLVQPSGSGGTTNNYGLYLTGNGGGSTNYAIYSASTASSQLSGDVAVARTSTTAFAVQTAGGASLFNADTSASQVTVGASAGSGSVLVNNGATVNTTLALGNFSSGGAIGTAAATVDVYTAITIGQTTSSQSLTIPTPTANTTYGRMLYVTNAGTVPLSFSNTYLTALLNVGSTATLIWQNVNGSAGWTYAGADGSSVLNQNAATQTANFLINGTGSAGTFSAATFNSTSNLTLQAASGNNITISPGAAGGGSGILNLAQNAATLNIGSGSNNARAINIGNVAGTQNTAVIIGNNTTAGTSTTTVQGAAGVTLQTNTATGGVAVKSTTNSTGAFQVQNSASSSIFTADTTNNTIQVGSSTTDATAVLFVLDSYNNATDPTGSNGSMYYNTALNSFRCYQNGAWMNCLGGLRYANAASTLPSGNTVANTTTQTAFTSSYTIPANDCVPGRVYRVTANGIMSGNNSANFQFRMKWGTTVIGDSGSNGTINASNQPFTINSYITCDVAGGSGTAKIEAQGFANLFYTQTNAIPWAMANTGQITSGIDTTTSNALTLTAQWSFADPANTITLRQLIVEGL